MARGDRLEVERRVIGSTVTYAHMGIDVGDGTVVHARPDDDRRPFGGGRVIRTGLDEFAAGTGVRIRRDPPAAFSPDEIVARALEHVGRDGYCPVVDNCEHFATWCATGRRASRQVDLVVDRISAAAGRVAAAVSARANGGIVVRTLAGSTVRVGLRTLVPAVLAGEAAALVAEWRAHQRGASRRASRRTGEAAGLVATMGTCAVAGLPAGPSGIVAGALAGATAWLAGSVVAAVVPAASRRNVRV